MQRRDTFTGVVNSPQTPNNLQEIRAAEHGLTLFELLNKDLQGPLRHFLPLLFHLASLLKEAVNALVELPNHDVLVTVLLPKSHDRLL